MKKFRIENYIKKNIQFLPNTAGFTLIELILVIGILSILSVVLLVTLNPYAQFQKANDAVRQSDLSQMKKALESFYQDNGRYPRSTGDPYYCLQDIASPFHYYCPGSTWQPYMNVVPKDPKSGNRYIYYASSDGQTYYLYASLERGANNSQACNNGGACSSLSGLSISANACGGICNYGVSTPDVSP